MGNKNKYKFFILPSVFLLASFLFFGVNRVLAATGWDPSALTSFGLSNQPISSIVQAILNWVLGIFGTIAVIAFAVSGIQYLMAAGNESTIETAKRHMVWSIVGVIVALSGLVIIYAIDAALNASSTF